MQANNGEANATAQAPQQQPQQHDLASISVSSRIAPFWRDMPRLWFSQFEAIIASQRLGQDTKFDLVIAKLNKDELSSVSELLENASREKNYATLKDKLLKTYQESADSQFNRLVKELELGDQKPSQLHRKMADAGRNSGVAEDTVKKLWLQRLPTAVRAVLVVSEDTKLENLAAMADKIMETLRQGVVAEVATAASTTNPSSSEFLQEFRNLALEVRQMRAEVNEIRSQQRSSQQGARNRSRSRSRDPNRLCRYHFRFREKARQCIFPCAWGRLQPQPTATFQAPQPTPQQGASYTWQTTPGN